MLQFRVESVTSLHLWCCEATTHQHSSACLMVCSKCLYSYCSQTFHLWFVYLKQIISLWLDVDRPTVVCSFSWAIKDFPGASAVPVKCVQAQYDCITLTLTVVELLADPGMRCGGFWRQLFASKRINQKQAAAWFPQNTPIDHSWYL